MDVEQVQKVNDLAVNLMKQGLVNDRDEAVAQAQKILNNESSVDLPAAPTNEPEVPEKSLSEDEVKKILEENSNFLVRKIKEFTGKIESLPVHIPASNNLMSLPDCVPCSPTSCSIFFIASACSSLIGRSVPKTLNITSEVNWAKTLKDSFI